MTDAEPGGGAKRIALMAAALAVFGLGLYATFGGRTPSQPPSAAPADPSAIPSAGSVAETSPASPVPSDLLTFPEGGRLGLERSALPASGPVSLLLPVPDGERLGGDEEVRIVSVDGRVLDLKARPGAGSGLQLDIDSAFLTRGRYLVQLRTKSSHPLSGRRFVLEIR